MANYAITGRLTGLAPLLARLERLKKTLRNKILRRAVTKAARALAKQAKALAPVDDGQTGARGLLKKSTGMKVSTERGGIVARIGTRTGFKAVVRIRVRGPKAGQPVYQDPARIAHLVELGHGGPAPAPPHPFMRPTWDGGKAAAEATVKAEILAGIEAEARR